MHSVLSLADAPPHVERDPCVMSWTIGRGGDGIHNTFMTLMQWPFILAESQNERSIFARKITSNETALLGRIDGSFMTTGWWSARQIEHSRRRRQRGNTARGMT